MKRLLFYMALLCLIPVLYNFQKIENKNQKSKEYQFIFKPGKTRITQVHKKQVEKIKIDIQQGTDVLIYPLSAYKSKARRSSVTNHITRNNYRKIWFDTDSKKQADKIVKFLKENDIQDILIERDFDYPLKGPSIRIKISTNFKISAKVEEKQELKIQNKQIPLKEYFPEKESQFFIINPKKDTLIEGKEGTKLFFASGSLLCDEPVQIELKEFYKTADFLKADLQTISNGKLLVTGGTIFLDARKKSDLSQQVKINPSRGINTEFTEGKDDPEMEVFLKDKNSVETNWIRDARRRWRYTRNYMLNEDEVYKSFVFNSASEYQNFVTSGEAKKIEKEWFGVIRGRAIEQRKKEREQAVKNDKTISRLTLNELGFINCDRFYNEATKPFEILADKSKKATYYAIISGENKGIIKGSGSVKIKFGNLPVNQPITVIAISISEEEKFIFKKKLATINESVGEIVLAKANEEDLNNLLSAIN